MLRKHVGIIALVLAFALLAASARAAAPSPAFGTRGMVVASEAEAARAGRAMFERGGNAVDAAIATAFALAKRGFPIGRYHARMIEFMRARGLTQRFPDTARIQFPSEGMAARPGWRLEQPELAATLRRVAADGPGVFYTGDLAKAIVDAVKSRGGILTLEDLATYQPVIRQPLSGSYRGYAIHTFPPPSSGGVAIVEALNILEGGAELAPLGAGSSASVHRIAEALKLSFADTLAFVGDPDFVSVPAAQLTEKPYAERLRSRIDPAWWRRAPWRWLAGREIAVRVEGAGLPANEAGRGHPARRVYGAHE